MFLAQRPDAIGRRPETAILPESRAALVPPHAQITCGAWPGRMARANKASASQRGWLLLFPPCNCDQSNTPATIDARLAACAFVIPKKDRGLMRINSTRNRAMPVSTK